MTHPAHDRLVSRPVLSPATESQEFEATREAHGVRAAGEWLVRRHASDVYAICLAIVCDRATAEDLTHESFGRALASLASFRGDASPRTWLLTIARHRCIDHLRAHRRERALLLAEEPDQVAADLPLTLDRLATSDQLRAAVAALDEADRTLVVMRFGHGLEFSDLASVFGAREATIRMRLSRALARMRGALATEAESSLASVAASPSAHRPPASYGATSATPPALESPSASTVPPPPAFAPAALTERPRRTSDRIATLARFVGDIFRSEPPPARSPSSPTSHALSECAPTELVERLLILASGA